MGRATAEQIAADEYETHNKKKPLIISSLYVLRLPLARFAGESVNKAINVKVCS